MTLFNLEYSLQSEMLESLFENDNAVNMQKSMIGYPQNEENKMKRRVALPIINIEILQLKRISYT